MLAEALGGGVSRVEKFRRDGWARPWPVGLEMLCYMLSHEAHHRGQVCMLAHQLGFPLPIEVTSGIWNWEKLWKECGSPGRPRLPFLRNAILLRGRVRVVGEIYGLWQPCLTARVSRLAP